jgi:geranylgeranyl diphosphate synthase type II
VSNGGRIEAALEEALARASAPPAPPRLCQALRHAVMPGGARIRPFISLSVARACGDDRPAIADAAAAALELIHCGSLVHDDMPCFDDAALRRGRPAVHVAHGEALALLVGDSLIVLAFDTLAQVAGEHCGRAAELIATLAGFTGMPRGICAGQGWESEEEVELEAYHRSQTGSLFVAATRMGAIAAGADPDAWTDLGARIGEAFQVADDLADATKPTDVIGKPAGQDDLHARPNAVRELGVAGAVRRLRDSLDAAVASIPACPGEEELCALVRAQAARLTPVGLPAIPS